MLNEAPADHRASAQGILTVFTSIGQLLGAAAVGAIVASHGGDTVGYGVAFQLVKPTTVASLPVRLIAAWPNGIMYSPSGTSSST